VREGISAPIRPERSIPEEALDSCSPEVQGSQLRTAVEIETDAEIPEGIPSNACHDSPTVNAVCECCSRNSFSPHELSRIDSGQRLCHECLGAFRKKAGEA
jgi:hypothetical protein